MVWFVTMIWSLQAVTQHDVLVESRKGIEWHTNHEFVGCHVLRKDYNMAEEKEWEASGTITGWAVAADNNGQVRS